MDTETMINNGQAPETFDVLSFVQATAYPTDEVVVFQDVKGATEYIKLTDKRNTISETDKKALTAINKEIEEVSAKIKASSIIFSLRGMPPGIVAEILKVPKGEEAEENTEGRDDELIARTIIAVRNANDVYDKREWDKEAVHKLREFLKEGEFGKLIAAVSSVNFNAMVFDNATDAGFPSGRSDMAQ